MRLDPALAETLPYILSLLGIAGAGASLAMMDAQVRRRRTLEAVKRIIIRESLKQPLVVIFEDLHWIDAETQELLDLLVDSVASARILHAGQLPTRVPSRMGQPRLLHPVAPRSAGAARAPTRCFTRCSARMRACNLSSG